MSMRDLAKKVGLQPGSLYYYFPSKISVLAEVLESLLQQRLSEWLAVKPMASSVLEELHAFLNFHIRRNIRTAREEVIVQAELRSLNGPLRDEILALNEAYVQELVKIVTSGMISGVFHIDNAELSSRCLLSLIVGVPGLPDSSIDLEERIVASLAEMSHRLLGVENKRRGTLQ